MSSLDLSTQKESIQQTNNEDSSDSLFDAQQPKRKSTYHQGQDSSDEEDKKQIEEEKKEENDQNKDAKDTKEVNNSQIGNKHSDQLTQAEKRTLLKKRKICGFIEGCDSIENYEKLNKIHEGVYGMVYRARDKLSGKICAIKKVKIDRQKEKEGFPITSIREFNLLLSLKHENIVGVQRVVVGPDLDKIFMIMEYCEHELKDLLDVNKYQFTESEIKCLMKQLLQAMKFMHQRNIMHRDLKTSNILYTNKGILKVCDFGLGRKSSYYCDKKGYTPTVVTLWYRAPEILLGNDKYDVALDMWSVGCIFAELLIRDPIFKGSGEKDQVQQIFKILGTPTDKTWKGWTELKYYPNFSQSIPKYEGNKLKEKIGGGIKEEGYNLLEELLCYDPSKRITAAKALEHPWFKQNPRAQATDLMPTFKDSNDIERNQRKKIKRNQ